MKTFKWTEVQKKALRGSIRKWQKIVNGTGMDESYENCPCCKIWNKDGKGDCIGCPIWMFTGVGGCEHTPYDIYIGFEINADVRQLEKNMAELNFLKAVYLAGGGK